MKSATKKKRRSPKNPGNMGKEIALWPTNKLKKKARTNRALSAKVLAATIKGDTRWQRISHEQIDYPPSWAEDGGLIRNVQQIFQAEFNGKKHYLFYSRTDSGYASSIWLMQLALSPTFNRRVISEGGGIGPQRFGDENLEKIWAET